MLDVLCGHRYRQEFGDDVMRDEQICEKFVILGVLKYYINLLPLYTS